MFVCVLLIPASVVGWRHTLESSSPENSILFTLLSTLDFLFITYQSSQYLSIDLLKVKVVCIDSYINSNFNTHRSSLIESFDLLLKVEIHIDSYNSSIVDMYQWTMLKLSLILHLKVDIYIDSYNSSIVQMYQ